MNEMWGTMPNNNNFMNNPYNRYYPHYETVRVKGEESARNFHMAPNSDALLLDETAPILYHVQTDGAGYITVMSYDLVPRTQTPSIDVNQLAQRLAQLEEKVNARQSNSQPNRQKKQRVSDTNTTTSNTGSQTTDESI